MKFKKIICFISLLALIIAIFGFISFAFEGFPESYPSWKSEAISNLLLDFAVIDFFLSLLILIFSIKYLSHFRIIRILDVVLQIFVSILILVTATLYLNFQFYSDSNLRCYFLKLQNRHEACLAMYNNDVAYRKMFVNLASGIDNQEALRIKNELSSQPWAESVTFVTDPEYPSFKRFNIVVNTRADIKPAMDYINSSDFVKEKEVEAYGTDYYVY